ncbi:MAG: polysaccharide biosynthesis C-terminal domain-containing protein [Terriglobales bacterium]
MRKLEKTQLLKNVGSSWFSLAINLAVGIFLSPFIIHRLGDAAYGIWVLIFSFTGYYGLFDLGIRSSIVRYVSKFAATEENEEISKLISTSLFTYTCIGAGSMLITITICIFLNRIFHIPSGFHSSARLLLLMVGSAVALGFPLGVFGGILEGLQKFYILNWTSIASTIIRAVLIVIFLDNGYGLLTAAAITVALPLLSAGVRAAIALRALPVRLKLEYVNRATLGEMANYSGLTFMIIVAAKLRFQTDEIVIGTALSAAAITYFSIGARIVDYATDIVNSLAQLFVPMSSQSDASGNLSRLRKIFVAGNRACAFTILPISATLIILGKSVIEVWVGRRYVEQSYPVLLILIIPCTVMLAQSASGRILLGMGRHKTLAIVSFVEGISNLLLSILLVRPYGIIGDAVGTAIPLTCTMVFFMPRHLCGKLGLRLGTFLREAYSLPVILCVPMAVVLLLLHHRVVPHTRLQLATQVFAAALTYGICMLWAFLTGRAFHVADLSSIESQALFEGSIPPQTEGTY